MPPAVWEPAKLCRDCQRPGRALRWHTRLQGTSWRRAGELYGATWEHRQLSICFAFKKNGAVKPWGRGGERHVCAS